MGRFVPVLALLLTLALAGCGQSDFTQIASPATLPSELSPAASRQMGFVEFDVPQQDATVGVVGSVSVTRSSAGGIFWVEVPAQGPYRLRATLVDGTELFADVEAFEPGVAVSLNALTTLTSLYRDRVPGLGLKDAELVVKRNFGIPTYLDIRTSLDEGERSPFRHADLLAAAPAAGGMNNHLRQLAATIQADGGFAAAATGLFGSFMSKTFSSIAGKAGQVAAGWVLNGLGLSSIGNVIAGKNPETTRLLREILSQIAQISSQIANLQTSVDQLQRQFQAAEFQQALTRASEVQGQLQQFTNNFTSLLNQPPRANQSVVAALADASTGVPQTTVASDLDKLHSALMGTSFPPVSPTSTILDGLASLSGISLASSEGGQPFGGLVRQASFDPVPQKFWAIYYLAQLKGLNLLMQARHAGAFPQFDQAGLDVFVLAHRLKLQRNRLIQYLESVAGLPELLATAIASGGLQGESINTQTSEIQPIDARSFGAVLDSTEGVQVGSRLEFTSQDPGPYGNPQIAYGRVTEIGPAGQSPEYILCETLADSPTPPANLFGQCQVTGGTPSVLPSAKVVYDRAQGLLWYAQPMGPFDSRVESRPNGLNVGPDSQNVNEVGIFNSSSSLQNPFAANPPDFYNPGAGLGSTQTALGDWVSKFGDGGLRLAWRPGFSPRWRLPTLTEQARLCGLAANLPGPEPVSQKLQRLGFFSRLNVGADTDWGNGKIVFWTSDSRLYYSAERFGFFDLSRRIQALYRNAVVASTGTVGGSSAPVGERTVPVLGNPDLNFSDSAPARAAVLLCSDLSSVSPPQVVGGTSVSPGGSLPLRALVGQVDVTSQVTWSVQGEQALRPDALQNPDLAAYQQAGVVISNVPGTEGLLTARPRARSGSVQVRAQLGSQSSQPFTVTINPNSYSDPNLPWKQDPCVSVTLAKDQDVVTANSNVTVLAYGRFRQAAVDDQQPTPGWLLAGDYSTDAYRGTGFDLFGNSPSTLLTWTISQVDGSGNTLPAPPWVAMVPSPEGGQVVSIGAIPSGTASPVNLLVSAQWNGKASRHLRGAPPVGTTVIAVISR